MASVLIAVGNTAADSADVTVAAGTPVTIFLTESATGPVDSDARVEVKAKAAGGTYHVIDQITGLRPAAVIDGPGTYRVSRIAGPTFGVDQG